MVEVRRVPFAPSAKRIVHKAVLETDGHMSPWRVADAALDALADAGYHIIREGEVPPWMTPCVVQGLHRYRLVSPNEVPA